MKLHVLAALVVLGGCADRALDTGFTTVDLARPGDGGVGGVVDLAYPTYPPVDGAIAPDGGPVIYDLAVPIDEGVVDLAGPDGTTVGAVDLASPVDAGASPGVPCGGVLCSTMEFCCGGTSGLHCATLASAGSCQAPLLRCDGPEDCPNNRVCVARYFGSMSSGTPTYARCRSRQNVGADERIVCHGNADCGGGTCTPEPTTVAGAPSISLCL